MKLKLERWIDSSQCHFKDCRGSRAILSIETVKKLFEYFRTRLQNFGILGVILRFRVNKAFEDGIGPLHNQNSTTPFFLLSCRLAIHISRWKKQNSQYTLLLKISKSLNLRKCFKKFGQFHACGC